MMKYNIEEQENFKIKKIKYIVGYRPFFDII